MSQGPGGDNMGEDRAEELPPQDEARDGCGWGALRAQTATIPWVTEGKEVGAEVQVPGFSGMGGWGGRARGLGARKPGFSGSRGGLGAQTPGFSG